MDSSLPLRFERLGNELCSALSCGKTSVFLAAPFVKSVVLEKLLSQLDSSVRLLLATRWRANEVAAGVSDLEVLDVCARRPRTTLILADSLHAKYYRVDDCVFIGSANLTGAALGWSNAPNLEILHRTPVNESCIALETLLLRIGIPATELIRDAVRAASNTIRDSMPVSMAIGESDVHESAGSALVSQTWFPRSRSPESIADCYLGRSARVTSSAMAAGTDDLEHLQVPPGLSESQLVSVLRAAVLQQPLVAALDEMISDSPRFGELRRRLGARFADEMGGRDVTDVLQTAMRWMVVLFPDRYRVRVYRFTEHLERVH